MVWPWQSGRLAHDTPTSKCSPFRGWAFASQHRDVHVQTDKRVSDLLNCCSGKWLVTQDPRMTTIVVTLATNHESSHIDLLEIHHWLLTRFSLHSFWELLYLLSSHCHLYYDSSFTDVVSDIILLFSVFCLSSVSIQNLSCPFLSYLPPHFGCHIALDMSPLSNWTVLHSSAGTIGAGVTTLYEASC